MGQGPESEKVREVGTAGRLAHEEEKEVFVRIHKMGCCEVADGCPETCSSVKLWVPISTCNELPGLMLQLCWWLSKYSAFQQALIR